MAAKKKEIKKTVSRKAVAKKESVKEAVTAKKTSVTDAQLKAAAQDLQKVISPSPAINLEAERTQLGDEIKEVAGMLAEGDEIQAETAMALKELGVIVPDGVKVAESAAKKEDKGMVKKVKAEKPVKGAKALAKAAVETSCFGHRIGSNGAVIDKEINAGGTFEAVTKRAKVEPSRLRGHIQHLKIEHNIIVTVDEKSGKVCVKK